jgi:hypothetical protein
LAQLIVEAVVGGVTGYAIAKILDQYLSIPLILQTRRLKSKGKAHEYEGPESVATYWKDLLGPKFGMEEHAGQQILRQGHLVTFRDILLTDFVPRAPGYYYSKDLWNDPKNALLSLGVVRIIENEYTGPKRLLAINHANEFEAHGNIEKGIPIVVSREVYEDLSEGLDKFGSVHLDQLTATMSDVGTYSEYLETVGIPATYPTVEHKKYIKRGGDPVPLMGNGWVVYRTKRTDSFLHYRFWTGVEYYEESLQNAKQRLKELIPESGWALTNFDDKIRYFRNAPLQLGEVWKHLARLKQA